jgi:hypothetical protein
MLDLFGKSKEEVRAWEEKLNSREKELQERMRNIEQTESDLANRMKILSSKEEHLSSKDALLMAKEEELTQKELNAKNDFIKQKREAFKEALEVRMQQMNAREEDLRAQEAEMEGHYADLKRLEGTLVARERAVKESELKAENGFADKNRAALREIEKREELCKSLETQYKEREEALFEKERQMERTSQELTKREYQLRQDELRRDEGFEQDRRKLQEELHQKRRAFLEEGFRKAEEEIQEKRKEKLLLLEKEIAEEKKLQEEALVKERGALEEKKKVVIQKENELDALRDALEYEKERLESKKEAFKEKEVRLSEEHEAKYEECRSHYEQQLSLRERECQRLREASLNSQEMIAQLEELKSRLGEEDPHAVLLKLKTYEEEIKNLRQELIERPTREMQEAFDRIKGDSRALRESCERLSEENRRLKESFRKQGDLEWEIDNLAIQKSQLESKNALLEADNNRLYEDLKRFQSSYEKEQDRDARIRDIEFPYIQEDLPRMGGDVDEIEWLDSIGRACVDYGLRFPRRILHAFHTSLKTSEWSPLTVLAGVSGTGKSELPRLYSLFGGMNFLSLAVQPNWDSQESMLGFFNSIDNKFDTQPVLRLLAQSQKEKNQEYPYGLKDVMTLILMDEMNLAHVELYFSEFLSKLELRRGCDAGNIPKLLVKLGAGVKDYELPLGRNILWTGTMNQDETTKPLSDKVLDRGIVINFPRPLKLERRKKLKPLERQNSLLPKKHWNSWLSTGSPFTEEQIMPYKDFIEEMNFHLSKVGRALGHRVWQSVEYYISNYPETGKALQNKDDGALVRAMKTAFEDQLVQKVMPKLRGIETRGSARTDCLDKIRAQLKDKDYSIVEDFDMACEFGYGQFIWNSANYLRKEDDNDVTASDSLERE